MFQGQGIALVPGCAAIDRGISRFSGDMRG
jgi:hypothetical protein